MKYSFYVVEAETKMRCQVAMNAAVSVFVHVFSSMYYILERVEHKKLHDAV